jgi:hypothetical protein
MPHAYATHLRDRHRVGQITGRMPTPESVRRSVGTEPAPDSPRPIGRMPAPDTVRGGGAVLALTRRAATAPRDGVTRSAAVVPLDNQNRFAARKAVAGLGWTNETPLVLTVTGAEVVIRLGTRTRPEYTPVSLDGQGRLTVPTRVLVTLGLESGDSLFLVALPQLDELRLFSASDVAALATGPMAAPQADVGETASAVAPATKPTLTRVRAAFQPAGA